MEALQGRRLSDHGLRRAVGTVVVHLDYFQGYESHSPGQPSGVQYSLAWTRQVCESLSLKDIRLLDLSRVYRDFERTGVVVVHLCCFLGHVCEFVRTTPAFLE